MFNPQKPIRAFSSSVYTDKVVVYYEDKTKETISQNDFLDYLQRNEATQVPLGQATNFNPTMEEDSLSRDDRDKEFDLGEVGHQENQKKNESDLPPIPGIKQVSPHDVFQSKDLGDHILDLYEDYKKNSDPELLEIIKKYSKHIGISFNQLDRRIDRRRMAAKFPSRFNKIPQRTAQEGQMSDQEVRQEISRAISNMIKHVNEWSVRDVATRFSTWGFWKGGQMVSVDELTARKILSSLRNYVSTGGAPPQDLDEISEMVTHYLPPQRQAEGNPFGEGTEDEEHSEPDLDEEEKKAGKKEGQAYATSSAMNPPAQNNYSSSPTQNSPAVNTSGATGTSVPIPPKPTLPAPPGKRYVLDKTTNTWVLIPVDTSVTL